MAMFTPRNQLQDMLNAEVNQALCGRADIGKMIALNSLMNNQAQPQQHIADNWLDDNWLNDSWL